MRSGSTEDHLASRSVLDQMSHRSETIWVKGVKLPFTSYEINWRTGEFRVYETLFVAKQTPQAVETDQVVIVITIAANLWKRQEEGNRLH